MAWLFAIVVLALAVWSKGFRKVLAGVLAVGALVGMGWYGYNERNERIAKTLVEKSQLVLEGEEFRPGTYGYSLTGRVRNNSLHTVERIELRIILHDCALQDTTKCDVVGETTASLVVTVPPTQVRDIDETVSFYPRPSFKGTATVDIQIEEIKAR